MPTALASPLYLDTNNMTCRQCRDSLPVLSHYFTTGILLIFYYCSLVIHIITGMIGMTMNNWTFAVSSSPDENHCEMVTDTPSVLLTIPFTPCWSWRFPSKNMALNDAIKGSHVGPGSPQFITSMHTAHT